MYVLCLYAAVAAVVIVVVVLVVIVVDAVVIASDMYSVYALKSRSIKAEGTNGK